MCFRLALLARSFSADGRQRLAEVGAAARVELGQAVADHAVLGHLLQVDHPLLAVVHRQQTDLVVVAQGVDRAGCARPGDVGLADPAAQGVAAHHPVVARAAVAGPHRAARVDGQHLGDGLSALGVGDLADDRQQLLELAVEVATESVGAGAADGHEAVAEVAGGRGDGAELLVGQVVHVDVDEHHRGVAARARRWPATPTPRSRRPAGHPPAARWPGSPTTRRPLRPAGSSPVPRPGRRRSRGRCRAPSRRRRAPAPGSGTTPTRSPSPRR